MKAQVILINDNKHHGSRKVGIYLPGAQIFISKEGLEKAEIILSFDTKVTHLVLKEIEVPKKFENQIKKLEQIRNEKFLCENYIDTIFLENVAGLTHLAR